MISFGPFRLFPSQRLLLEGDMPVRLGSRALDILAALVERPGEVVGKDELIARAWPATTVEEGNLKLQVSALRRALGDGRTGHRYIVTVPGRGYNFVAPVSHAAEPQVLPSSAAAEHRSHNLPARVTRMIGRDETVAALLSRLSRERLVTLVGPGGIGKTTVALAIAEAMMPAHEHGVWLIDLAPITEPQFVPSAAATALGLEIHAEDPLPGLVASVRDKRMLLVIDNCEHLIDAAASLAAGFLSGAPGISMLATSREPLRIVGEREYRLGPLVNAPLAHRLTAADAMEIPAVQLFVERVAGLVDDFALTDADAPLVVQICRRLDGLPLAIEFAAARVEVFGIRGLAAQLDNGLQSLGTRLRTTPPRQRTISAVIDWSYELLADNEKLFLRRLGVFAGDFTIEAAANIAGEPAHTRGDAIDVLGDLVAKSLLAANIGGFEPRFRLLEIVRAYALEKLGDTGERETIARRHAVYHLDAFERAETEWETRVTAEWLADYGSMVDDLRAALDWAYSPKGDAPIGVALTVVAVPLWMQLSLLEECRSRVEQALRSIAMAADRDRRCEMKLYAALAASSVYTTGVDPEVAKTWTKVLEIAESLDDIEYLLRALWGLWTYHINGGQNPVALELAERFRSSSAKGIGTNDRLVGERMVGLSQHLMGNQLTARDHFERMLADYDSVDRRSPVIRFQFDLQVWSRVFLAWTLWLQGLPDQAMRTIEICVEDARAANHGFSLCYALARVACPIALLVGDLAAAECYVAMLLDHATRHGLALWGTMGRSYHGALVIRRGDFTGGLQLLRASSGELGEPNSIILRLTALMVADAFTRTGQMVDGFATIEKALAWTERSGERWAIAELLRIKGELLLLQSTAGATGVPEHLFREALDWARRQDALSWELRAATSLARLLWAQGRPADAVAVLKPEYGRFNEGFDTADLKAAKALLDALQ